MGATQSFTLVYKALRDKNEKQLKKFAEDDKKNNTSLCSDLLLEVIVDNDERDMLYLLKCGVDPNKVGIYEVQGTKSTYKVAPLTFSVMYINMMKILLDHGANPNQITLDKNVEVAPLYALCEYHFKDKNLIEKMQLLISKGANVNMMIQYNTNEKLSPLMVAIKADDINEKIVDIVNLFLQNNYDLSLKLDELDKDTKAVVKSKTLETIINERIKKNGENDPRNVFLKQVLTIIESKKTNLDGTNKKRSKKVSQFGTLLSRYLLSHPRTKKNVSDKTMTRALKKWVHENPPPRKKSKKKQARKSTSSTKKRKNKSKSSKKSKSKSKMTPKQMKKLFEAGLHPKRPKSCRKQFSKKYTSRKSPPYPANECCGHYITGNNGQEWVSKRASNGVCKWVPVK
jgi:hypothetical protein